MIEDTKKTAKKPTGSAVFEPTDAKKTRKIKKRRFIGFYPFIYYLCHKYT